jgi:dTDP-4-dehydrorhamnose 3,5-epimerase
MCETWLGMSCQRPQSLDDAWSCPDTGFRMIFTPTGIAGAYVVGMEPHHDERGFFARTFCESEFGALELATRYPQCNVSFNRARFTLRGLHYAAAPETEQKLVRCTRGSIYDVILDLRADSLSCFRWCGVELSWNNHQMLYVPAGVAHGFLTLEDDTEVFYQMGAAYVAGAARAVRWDDPRFRVEWPHPPALMSDRDRSAPDFAGGPLTW